MNFCLFLLLLFTAASSILAQSGSGTPTAAPLVPPVIFTTPSPSPNADTTSPNPVSNDGQASSAGGTSTALFTILSTLPGSTTTPPYIPVPIGVDSISSSSPTSPTSTPAAFTTVLSTILSALSVPLVTNPDVPISTPIISTTPQFTATTILSTINNGGSNTPFVTALSTISTISPSSPTVSVNIIPTVSSQSDSVIVSTNVAATGTTNQAITITGTLSTGGGDSSTATSNFIGSATVTYGNNGAPTVSPAVRIQLPVLKQCSYATFDFVGPTLPKHLGIFTKGSPHFFETYNLPDSYNSMTNGSFTWTVDLPVGLSVGMMFYVLIDNIIPSGGSATTPYGIVQPGSSSDCVAQNNDLVNTSIILSYASSLDPQFKYSGPTITAGGGGVVIAEPIHPNPIAEIVGGIVGGLALFALIATAFFFTYRNRQERTLLDDDSTFAGTIGSEKHGSFYQQSQQTTPPPFGTSGNTYYDSTNLNGVDEYGRPLSDASRYSDYRPVQTAQPGTLPEPMDADEVVDYHPNYSPNFSSAPVSPDVATGYNQSGGTSSSRPFGHQGLADPNSFSLGSERINDGFTSSGREAPMMVDEA